ncbi:hypothetical protein TcWFU_007308 [Taenia crassiceps]|uniref:Uncharacterized protein n=1 Tax=Taenia crassiceps TaxID=6207 RepID=A0ABR4Q3R6_9CEST
MVSRVWSSPGIRFPVIGVGLDCPQFLWFGYRFGEGIAMFSSFHRDLNSEARKSRGVAASATSEFLPLFWVPDSTDK